MEPSGPRSRKSKPSDFTRPEATHPFRIFISASPLPSEVDGPAGRRSPAGPSSTWAIPAARSGAAGRTEGVATLLRFSSAAQERFVRSKAANESGALCGNFRSPAPLRSLLASAPGIY